MLFIKLKNLSIEKYPYYESDLKADFPNTSFPEDLSICDLSDFGVYKVIEVTKPTADYTKVVEDSPPENVDGKWTQRWTVRDATPQEQAAAMTAITRQYTDAIQQYLDATAQTRNYANIISACSYAAGNHPKYSIEGQDCLNWREAVWDKGYEILNDVQNGVRPLPTIEQVIAELPPMIWSV